MSIYGKISVGIETTAAMQRKDMRRATT